MYIPRANQVEDRSQLAAFMRAYPFATLVSLVEGQLFATHLPLVIDMQGEEIRLRGHLAKANPQWRELTARPETLVIFQGPHAYISPANYANRESVPTWNYVAVHAYGAPRLVEDREETVALLAELIANNDPAYQTQWDGLSDKYRNGMLNGIIAFEIAVTRLEGKYKLSQNRPIDDQTRVAAALAQHPDTLIAATGEMMQTNLESEKTV